MTEEPLREELAGSEYRDYPKYTVEYRNASHRYWLLRSEDLWGIRGIRTPVVSVTSALKVLDKPALLNWAEAAGAEGAIILERLGELDGVPPAEAVDRVRLHKLGHEAKKKQGADRGSSVHRVLEAWGVDRSVPNLGDFPAEHRGFVQGLCAWLLEARPEPTSTERIVGSLEHGYAGRMDMRAVIDGFDCIVDLKTSPRARVYDEAHLQTRAYALADVECGAPEPDACLIVAVGDDGEYTVEDCVATEAQWLAVLRCHREVGELRRHRMAIWRDLQRSIAADSEREAA